MYHVTTICLADVQNEDVFMAVLQKFSSKNIKFKNIYKNIYNKKYKKSGIKFFFEHTEWTDYYRKSVVNLLNRTLNLCLGRCSTDLRRYMKRSVEF